ncbi:hypothetical protein PGH12_11095 [Chryseobacterium wangxinyae]|uniref:hypothetical protein n=1 Tax=Chryseobacterium sp. CY350 TaxID=2997336 RepID=UPI00226DE68A|nr:hypothetical protein [Chryseobacterium sp. CY350]MCY0976385.1 hypothetical protein [Chryseobacterium sp. CY350]WBZ94019.1 hypothetical protein PGH12_11095 [Chryseobacterium sp. CY350]
MSTNLNTNNSSQTLFRFAAMRNPELSDPKNLERRFIFREKAIADESIFDTRLLSGGTLQTICRDVDENPGSITLIYTEANLKTTYGSNFYDLAVWVARNKSTSTKEEFDKKFDEYNGIPNVVQLGLPERTRIWDNLVYQVVTQKDFYAKELIMQYLHLNHILTVYDKSEESFEDMKRAKVVLPKELFKVSQSDFNSAGSSLTQKTMYDDKAMKFAEATIGLKENQSLVDSLSKLEKTYKKQHDAAYKEAYNEYQNTIKPLLKSSQKEASEADRKKQILENRINYLTQLSVADPEKFYANSEMDMELHRIKDEIMQITTPEIEIPEFDFKFETTEIDIAKLGRTMSVSDQNALLRILGSSSLTEALSDISSFDELSQNITQSNQSLQQTVLNNTVLNQQVSTNVGGVIIPVSKNTSNSNYIPFSVKTYARSSTEWSLLLALSNNMEVISANYKIVLNSVDYPSTSVSSMGAGSCLLFDLPRILVSQTSGMGGFILQGEVKLSDGNTYTLSVTLIKDPNDLDLRTKQYHFRGDAGCLPVEIPPIETPTNPGNPETPTYNPTDTSSFIPSGFGMKNIGVADYLKVEQSTYCYVEGDVAHIENIMAREYKERATRRLKRSESQTTKSTESEKEKLTDTTTTERHEMQSEISKILQESKDFAAQAGFNASWGGATTGGVKFGLSANASYATHNSKEESNRQAVTEAKDITARALDRIVTKVKEERIDKVLEEYEENNKHGFDNTKGSSHVVGVYRWVDKVVKNQIYNYGKRMMFEFMIPEPAKLHTLGVKMIDSSQQLVKPIDPRSLDAAHMQMKDFTALNNDVTLNFWSSKFNVEIDDKPLSNFSIGKSLGGQYSNNISEIENVALKDEIQIPENYVAVSGSAQYTATSDGDGSSVSALLGNAGFYFKGSWGQLAGEPTQAFSSPYSQLIPISTTFYNQFSGTVNFTINLNLTLEAKNAWLRKTFNKIIEAYELELEKYNQALSEAKALGVQIKGSNPGFYRKIENTVLRKNCISYMIDQNPGAALTFGKNKYYQTDNATESFTNTEIKLDSGLDQYAAFVKFMEQAFEWDIMSYYFYPYYWGKRDRWSDMYQFDDNDPTFRAFMQSGMARVIVTVRPGFEEAVRHFLATGQIWNGGEVPVIDDPMFLSIVDEMRSALGKKQGEPWREKIPTSLTILQADSIGLRVEKALPCNCEPGVKFDDQLGEMCGSNFELNNNQIGQSADKWVQISFNEMHDNSFKTILDYVKVDYFPKTYTCLGNSFEIEKEFDESESSIKIYKRISEEVSQIEGVEAYPTGENGITFKVNARLIKNFDFSEVNADPEEKKLAFTTDSDTYLKVTSPVLQFGIEKILDKDGQPLTTDEYTNQAPLSKFLV